MELIVCLNVLWYFAVGRHLEENSLEEKHDILHPTVSSVCYLTGDGGGPTVVFDQTSNDVTPSPKAYGKRIFTLK